MTEFILLLSKCDAKLKKMKEGKRFYQFHFKGFYNGVKIKQIVIEENHHLSFIPDEDYLLMVRFLAVSDGILKVEHVKSKRII